MFEGMIDRRQIARILAMALLSAGTFSCPPVMADDKPAANKVKLVIDYGDDVQKHFSAIPWKKDMTIADVLDAASKHPRGIKIETRGSGETLFLMKVDGVKNEGRGKNWLYSVNDEKGEVSYGIMKVQAGDVVLWRFGEYR